MKQIFKTAFVVCGLLFLVAFSLTATTSVVGASSVPVHATPNTVADTVAPRKAENGVFRFETPLVPDKSVTLLDGTWNFYWNRFLPTAVVDTSDVHFVLPCDGGITVPGYWKEFIAEKTGSTSSIGSGTYQLTVENLHAGATYAVMIRESPGTACRLFLNGTLSAECGKVSLDATGTEPEVRPVYAECVADSYGSVEIILQVSNYAHRKGGVWSSVVFASQPVLYKYYNTQIGMSWLTAGTLFILGALNFVLFLLTPKNRQSLYFSIFAIVLALRIGIGGFSVFSLEIPAMSYALQVKLEYLALWLAPCAYLFMLCRLYPAVPFNKFLRNALVGAVLLLGLVGSALPLWTANRMVPVFECGTLCVVLYILVFLIRASIRREKSVLLTFAGFLVLAAGMLFEMFFTKRKGVMPFSFMPIFTLIFSIIQFLLLAWQQRLLFQEKLHLVEDMRTLNDAYLRFVPREFLQLLNKQSMTDVQPGDFVEREMTINFSQMYFSSQNGDIAPEEQYSLFSSCLLRISPIISTYNGFISKFISHGFMALFPDNPVDAVLCSLAVQKELQALIKEKNAENARVGKKPVKLHFGTGVHYGKMILGTIGETNRLDDTVISDIVNTASRIEAVAERTGNPVLVSSQAYEVVLPYASSSVAFRVFDTLSVKGKSKAVTLYTCVPKSFEIEGDFIQLSPRGFSGGRA